jgi:hypothetical protein
MLQIAARAKKFRLNYGTHTFKQVISFNSLMSRVPQKARQNAIITANQQTPPFNPVFSGEACWPEKVTLLAGRSAR